LDKAVYGNDKVNRGFIGIVFFEPKFKENIGTAIRSANCFGANFIGVIGKRYTKQPSDTMFTEKHIPIYEYKDTVDFLSHIPIGCKVVGFEVDGCCINKFIPPERVVYIFGGEDRMLPQEIETRISISTSHCLNMSATASIALFNHRSYYDRKRQLQEMRDDRM
jgi:tRNA(Leu) C34 or U34 (ribose-2'-O)-methylase TrmL